MKKQLFFFGIALLMILQSCSITTETIFHKNSTSSLQLEMDFKELMQFSKNITSDSLQNDDKKIKEIEKIPKEWTSFYDMELKEGKTIKNPDSIKIMKKMFMKSNVEDGEIHGISMKFDRFTKSDYEFLEKNEKEKTIPVNSENIKNWNGKTLTIDTKNFNLDDIEETMKKTVDEEDEELSEEEIKEKAEQTKMMMKMINLNVTSIMRFESKIKSVSGKHDWIQLVDDHTIKINFSWSDLVDNEKKLINKDEKIVITTE